MQSTVVENGIKARYIGQNVGARLIHGNDGRAYRGGNNRDDRFQFIHPDDVELLKDSFAVVESPKDEPASTIHAFANGDVSIRSYTHKGAMVVNAEAFSITEGASDEQGESAGQPRKRGTK